VNGLYIKNGGTLLDLITNNIVQRIREKLQRKYKSIKPGDIKNKLMIVGFFKGFKNLRFDSQTKERITNSFKEVSEYLGDINYDKISQKVLKNKDIIDPITEVYRIKEEFKKRQELKKLSSARKKIKSEKYLSATKTKKILFICEGASAVGGLMPSLGREEYGFYELKGVPLNAYDASSQKFTQNKELTELYQIAQNEGYQYICTATDQDADGSHIKGLLLGFFKKYLPEFIEQKRFCELKTPVQAAIKNKKLQRWTYNLGEKFTLKRGEVGKYYKGLGSWSSKDLKYVVETDGIDNMISAFDIDDEKIVDDWLNSKNSDIRKSYIQENEFDITGI
jgi:DNA gyrase/topoisomerase IV subunit B